MMGEKGEGGGGRERNSVKRQDLDNSTKTGTPSIGGLSTNVKS